MNPEKKQYTKPELDELGKVPQLTEGGSGSTSESFGGATPITTTTL